MDNHDGLLLDAEKLAAELRKRGDEWADRDAAYKALEDVQRSVLAECMLEATAESISLKEAQARSCDTFKSHLASLADARQKANRAKVAYDVWKVYLEMVRTNASSHRTMAGML